MFYENSSCAFQITGVFHVERCEADAVTEKMRKHTSLSYRIAGESSLKVEEEVHIVGAGSVTFIPAGTDYKRTSTPEELIVIHLQSFGQISESIECIADATAIEPLFRKLLSAWNSGEIQAYSRAMQILYEIFEALQNLQNTSPPVLNDCRPAIMILNCIFQILPASALSVKCISGNSFNSILAVPLAMR